MPDTYDRRAFLAKAAKGGAAFTVLGGAGGLLEACGGGNATTTTTLAAHVAGQVGVNPPPKGAKLGGSVTFGTEAEESGMDPTYAHFDSTGVMYARAVYDPLAMVTYTGDVVPYLAESILPNNTFTEWTITLRPGVVFHDGTPCDGAALTFCMQHFQSSILTNFAVKYWKPNGIKQTGPLSCTISMYEPWVPFPAWLAGYIGGQIAYVFSPTQYNKAPRESLLNVHPVGTGPFMFKEWDVNNFFTLTRNPHYWRKDALGRQLPYLDEWTFRPLPTVSERWDALQGNSIQIMHTDDDPTILSMEADGSIDLILDNELPIGEPDCLFGMINTSNPLLSDITLRQAIAYSFDQERYCQVIGKGLCTPITTPFPTSSPYYSTTGYPAYDPAKAASLLKSWQSAHGGSVPNFTYGTTSTPTSLYSAEFVQGQFQAAGFKVKISAVLQSQLVDDALFGDFDVFSWRQFANIDPDLNYPFWSAKSGGIDFSRNNDPVINDALDAARQTTNPQVRVEKYQTVAERFAVDLPYIWAGRDVWCVGANKQVQNWDNPTTVTGNQRGAPMLSGIIWPTEIWLNNL